MLVWLVFLANIDCFYFLLIITVYFDLTMEKSENREKSKREYPFLFHSEVNTFNTLIYFLTGFLLDVVLCSEDMHTCNLEYIIYV